MRGFALFALTSAVALAAPKHVDFAGYKDPALVTRLPNYWLAEKSSFVEKQFDGRDFRVMKGGKEAKQRVEGHLTQYYYYFDFAAGAPPSDVQVVRNYKNALEAIGGEVLFEGPTRLTARVAKDGRETWLEVDSHGGPTYYLYLVEREQLKQDVVANAASLREGLDRTGHVDVPGVYFDSGKAELKPESAAALQEVAKLLTEKPALKLWVVGHTDWDGTADDNVTLSKNRAAAVIKFLESTHTIDGKRLGSFGAGPYAPVATNTSDAGRAKNRRVELVQQR